MAFSKTTIEAAYARANGRCECSRCHAGMHDAPHHAQRCLSLLNEGDDWEAHHKHSTQRGGDDSLSNCEILCPVCKRLAKTFGTDTF
jgi:hypothetical protein